LVFLRFNMEKLDEKNCIILNLLQENCRISLTNIAKKVNLSVDSVKKRINKMIKKEIFYPKIQIRPRSLGFNNIVDIKIKVHNCNNQELEKFIEYLKKHPRIAEVFSVSGAWNFSIVLIAKDYKDLGEISTSIRNKFSKIINGWSESLTTTAYKFENYDLLKLMKIQEDKKNE